MRGSHPLAPRACLDARTASIALGRLIGRLPPGMSNRSVLTRPLALVLVLVLASRANAAEPAALPHIDFTDADVVARWQAQNDVAPLRHTPEGMHVRITGADPFLAGPAIDLPAGEPLWLTLRLNAHLGGRVEVFYYTDGPRPQNAVAANVAPGDWRDVRLPLPPLGPGYHIRIDPPGTRGEVTIASLRFERRRTFEPPAWPKPVPAQIRAADTAAASVRSGELEVLHAGKVFGGFAVRVGGENMAAGLSPSVLGYVHEGEARWVELGAATVEPLKPGPGFVESASLRDADGAEWTVRRTFAPAKAAGAVDVRVEVRVGADRSVTFLPMLALLPGAGSFGTSKTQAVFAGLEYLADEPSSSEADITGPASKRQVPDSLKITFPLMAVSARDRYIGLAWEKAPSVSAVFDSPDRQFQSGGHVMGLIAPGSDGQNRPDGSQMPYLPAVVPAGEPLTLSATIIGGPGNSVVPAVQKYVELRGLPPVPDTGLSATEYAALAAGGWLDSQLRAGNRYRHAVWPGFEPRPAADAAVWMTWLARQTDDAALAGRLTDAAAGALAEVPAAHWNASRVSHIGYPVASLLFGHVEENAAAAEEAGRRLLGRFEPDGRLLYRRDPAKPDFGRTHSAPDANGLTATSVTRVLECAAASGDEDLIREGVRLLRAMDSFADSVPRGAQTWEVPLHTPDVLASAALVRAYVLGYELTGEAHFLEQARYWAWTGVPFVYLQNPTDGPIGPYATIAVYGATGWEAPIWFGQPVQWCGLVYADALYRLLPHDPGGPWERLADGIAASGVQQTWPATDRERQGLLPDFVHLREQTRDGPGINPGTVGACAARLYDQPPLYDFRCFRKAGLIVHAPGAMTDVRDDAGAAEFTVEPWTDRPCFLLICGAGAETLVRVNGAEPAAGSGLETSPAEGRIVVPIRGKSRVSLGVAER